MNEEIMQYQVYKNQLEQIKEYQKQLETQKQTIIGAIEALEEIKKTNKGTRILAPIASGIFVESEISNTQEVVALTGANTVVKKTVPEIVESLHKELENIDRYKAEINMQKMQISNMVDMIQASLIAKKQEERENKK